MNDSKVTPDNAARMAAEAYRARLTMADGNPPTYAPEHGSGAVGANPWIADSDVPEVARLHDAYCIGWLWAHQAESFGRQIGIDNGPVTAIPFGGVWGDIFAIARGKCAYQFGHVDEAPTAAPERMLGKGITNGDEVHVSRRGDNIRVEVNGDPYVVPAM